MCIDGTPGKKKSCYNAVKNISGTRFLHTALQPRQHMDGSFLEWKKSKRPLNNNNKNVFLPWAREHNTAETKSVWQPVLHTYPVTLHEQGKCKSVEETEKGKTLALTLALNKAEEEDWLPVYLDLTEL